MSWRRAETDAAVRPTYMARGMEAKQKHARMLVLFHSLVFHHTCASLSFSLLLHVRPLRSPPPAARAATPPGGRNHLFSPSSNCIHSSSSTPVTVQLHDQCEVRLNNSSYNSQPLHTTTTISCRYFFKQ